MSTTAQYFNMVKCSGSGYSDMGKVAWWVKALQLNRKVPDSNPNMRSARPRDPTSLRDPCRYLGQI